MPDREEATTEDGSAPELTLIATLRQAFSAKVGCEMRYNLVHMWDVIDEDCDGLLDEHGSDLVERLINGEPIEKRKRCLACALLL